MGEGDEWRGKPSYDESSPWPVLALGVVLALVCLIVIARMALTIIAG